ncbi:unnamed protein product [Caenorhabditis bovis]|uniref:Choline/carnitine acyltransferase domain-containing protein n=1 Tax=Caenorhabditis bovis TaxID=2654633 RepID=A0A8S1EDF9_9PELO|nr:unnamed protein product [Caenorhabditis bovis]
MSTFSRQDQLPSLPVPPLHETLQKYLKSASAILSDSELAKLERDIEQFENSDLAAQLQTALESRAKLYKNWLDNWWYDAYVEVRQPLLPYLSLGAINDVLMPIEGGQICRAADILHHWVGVWDKLRNEQWPITVSRGVTWDMAQFHHMFNSNRTPKTPSDVLERFFRTKSEGDCPSHVIVCCRGTLWKLDVLNRDGSVKSADQLYSILNFIEVNSTDNIANCVVKLTTTDRDTWAKNRDDLLRVSNKNLEHLHDIETSILFLTLATSREDPLNDLMKKCLVDESWFTWQDKSISLTVYENGHCVMTGDHSNLDGIVLLQVNEYVAAKVRQALWHPARLDDVDATTTPTRLDFELSEPVRVAIAHADVEFFKTKAKYRARAVHFHGFGNDLCREAKIYADTVVQIALQLAFAKTHGSLAPIYETASTRKFYHGRTETLRGLTPEFVKFADAFFAGGDVAALRRRFVDAVDAHNRLMADCMDGRGFDRHLFGLKKTLESMNKGCGPSRALPAFMCDETWRRAGGDGNFLLSTSFIGYMPPGSVGTLGYVTAMRPDGYGCFYRIGKNRISVAVSDWIGTRSNIDAFCANVDDSLTRLATLIAPPNGANSKI